MVEIFKKKNTEKVLNFGEIIFEDEEKFKIHSDNKEFKKKQIHL